MNILLKTPREMSLELSVCVADTSFAHHDSLILSLSKQQQQQKKTGIKKQQDRKGQQQQQRQ